MGKKNLYSSGEISFHATFYISNCGAFFFLLFRNLDVSLCYFSGFEIHISYSLLLCGFHISFKSRPYLFI